jgi:hypothetical protein
MSFEEWAVVSVPIIKYVHPLMQLFSGLAGPVSVGTTGDGNYPVVSLILKSDFYSEFGSDAEAGKDSNLTVRVSLCSRLAAW